MSEKTKAEFPATTDHKIEYLSPPAGVSMSDNYFQLADTHHFWVHRRFKGMQQLAGNLLTSAREMAEVACGHGLLQRQVEKEYAGEVTAFRS
jgi:hypothetical protein